MKKITFLLIIACALLAGCKVTKNYYLTLGDVADNEEFAQLIAGLGGSENVRNLQPEQRIHKVDKYIKYDSNGPTHIRIPELLETPGTYNPEDKYTFPIYGNVQTVAARPSDGDVGNRAIWCTKDATYLATVYQQYWDMHYFQCSSKSYISDSKTGKKYYIIEKLGLPMDVSYFIKDVAGSYICTVEKYPALPKSCTTIDIVGGKVNDDVKNGLGWSHRPALRNIPVAALQDNQHITEYREIKVIE